MVGFTPPSAIAHPACWERALSYEQFVAGAEDNRDLWEGVYRVAQVPDWAVAHARTIAEGVRLLVLAEDWCGDAVNAMPVLAKLADAVEGVEVRVLRRDEHPKVMDAYLTNGARAIPIVIALDRALQPLGHWGPRPTELQAWVMAHKDTMPKDVRYREVRRWYARDRGVSTLREVLALYGEVAAG